MPESSAVNYGKPSLVFNLHKAHVEGVVKAQVNGINELLRMRSAFFTEFPFEHQVRAAQCIHERWFPKSSEVPDRATDSSS